MSISRVEPTRAAITSRIHRLTVTQADLDDVGSVTVTVTVTDTVTVDDDLALVW